MHTRSWLIAFPTILASICLAGCQPHRQARHATSAQRITLTICSGLPGCTPSQIGAGVPDPLALKSTAITGHRVERMSPPAETYTIWQGTYGHPPQGQASVELDLSDLLPATDPANLAGAEVRTGWAAMVRSTGKPPLRTIRITTGRPGFDSRPNGISQQNPARLAGEYAVLVAIDPNATAAKGIEAYFLATPPGTSHSLTLLVGKPGSTAPVTLTSGQYLLVDRASSKIPSPVPFPKQTDLVQPAPWIVEAIKAAKVSGYEFGNY